jgi:hypothetical protein
MNGDYGSFAGILVADATLPGSPYETIIVHSLSRFFRDSVDFGLYERRLNEAGVRLIPGWLSSNKGVPSCAVPNACAIGRPSPEAGDLIPGTGFLSPHEAPTSPPCFRLEFLVRCQTPR